MFYFLNGEIAHIEAGLAVLNCGGVGFCVHSSNESLGGLKKGEKATLYTHCVIREDAFDIYGFLTLRELSAFRMLIGVSGVGPKAALSILSSTNSESFVLAILSGDEKALTAAPGVGKKLAQRIILELKDKLASAEQDYYAAGTNAPAAAANFGGKAAEAGAALAVLGYSQSDIAAALRGVDTEGLEVADIVRAGLKNMLR